MVGHGLHSVCLWVHAHHLVNLSERKWTINKHEPFNLLIFCLLLIRVPPKFHWHFVRHSSMQFFSTVLTHSWAFNLTITKFLILIKNVQTNAYDYFLLVLLQTFRKQYEFKVDKTTIWSPGVLNKALAQGRGVSYFYWGKDLFEGGGTCCQNYKH